MLPSTVAVAVGILVHKSLHMSVILIVCTHILHKLHLLPEQHKFQINPLAGVSWKHLLAFQASGKSCLWVYI